MRYRRFPTVLLVLVIAVCLVLTLTPSLCSGQGVGNSNGGGRLRRRYSSPNVPGGGEGLTPSFVRGRRNGNGQGSDTCIGSQGACPSQPSLYARRLPVSLGSGPRAFTVSTPAVAAQVFQHKVAPGACNPVSKLLVQLLTARLNIAQGASVEKTSDANAPATEAALSEADAWLGNNAWISEDFSDYPVVNLRAWARRLHNFNLASGASGAGRCGPSLPCADDPCEEQDALDERMGMFALPTIEPGSSSRARPMGLLWFNPASVDAALAGPYATRNMPQIDVAKLGYSARDWERFDGYDFQSYALKDQVQTIDSLSSAYAARDIPTVPGAPGAATSTGTGVSAKFVQDFLGAMNGVFRTTYFGSAYTYFRVWNANDNKNIYRDLFGAQGTYSFYPQDVLLNTSMSLNQFYNAFRQNKKASIRAELQADTDTTAGWSAAQFDAATHARFDALELDFARDVPGVNGTIAWLEMYIAKHLSFQLREHRTCSWANNQYDCYGIFRTTWWYPGLEPSDEFILMDFWWNAGGIGYTYSRYVHLLSDSTIRSLRQMAMAALIALDTIHGAIGSYDWHAQSQWLLRQGGTTAMAFLLKRSEDVLRARGSWSDATDFFVTNKNAGTYSTADAIAAAEARVGQVLSRVQANGLVEYLSSYQSLCMQELEMAIMHAASPLILQRYQRLLEIYWADLVLNYMPGSNSFPGPSSRTYDLVAGAHNIADRYDLPLVVQWAERTWCSQPIVKYSGMGNDATQSVTLPTDLCSSGSVSVIPSSGKAVLVFQRVMAGAWQAGGHLYLPLDLMKNVVQSTQHRLVEQRFSAIKGQERFNFITPYLQMGHAGEDYYSEPTAVFVCARLGGLAAAGKPTSQDQNGPTNSVPYIRLMPEMSDTPFRRTWEYDVAGKDLQRITRQIVAQHESFMLTSHVLSPRQGNTLDVEGASPFQTNLILPLAVDGLYAGTRLLPTDVGTVMALPLNSIITVRHLGAAVSLRLLHYERHEQAMPPILDAPTFITLPYSQATYGPGAGRQQYSLTWIVDADSTHAGSGRLVLHHKHKGADNKSLGSYRSAWAMLGGQVPNSGAWLAMQAALRTMPFVESIVNTNWNPATQTFVHDGTSKPRSSSRWKLQAVLGGVTLAIDREDVYEANRNNVNYQQPPTGSAYLPPFYVDPATLSRTVNGQQMQQWSGGEKPFRITKINPNTLFTPY